MRYAFINAESIVVQLITGTLNDAQQAQFLRDYSVLFGAVAIVGVESDTMVWIGGSYTDGQFLPPPQPEPLPEPQPEPEPEVIEGTSEELLPSEVPDDALPG
jgi:hypothetical protein